MSADEVFRREFGTEPTGRASVPGRVNLIGEHTDYNGGLVLPMPIPFFTHVSIGPGESDHDEIHSDRFSDTVRVDPGQPKKDHWADYAVGALQAARSAGWISSPQQVAITGNVPDGVGLSSSASLIVAVLKAAAATSGIHPGVEDISRRAQAVESSYVGMPCGIMDQMAVAGGVPGKAMLLNTDTLDYRHVAIPSDWHIAVIHSGVRRSLAEGRYAERRRECEQAGMQLQAGHLCQLTDAQKRTAETLEPVLARRARHAWTEQERVLQSSRAIENHDLEEFGRLLLQGHASLRDEFEVSVPKIDTLVQAAVSAGAAGARLTGGGFGGCIVAVMVKEKFDPWRSKLADSSPDASVLC